MYNHTQHTLDLLDKLNSQSKRQNNRIIEIAISAIDDIISELEEIGTKPLKVSYYKECKNDLIKLLGD